MLNYLNLAISIERFQLLSQTPTELFKTRSRHLGKRYWRDLLDVYDSKCYEVKEQKIGIRHTPVSHVNFQITNLIFTSTVVANCVEKRDRLYWTCTFVENKKNWGKGIWNVKHYDDYSIWTHPYITMYTQWENYWIWLSLNLNTSLPKIPWIQFALHSTVWKSRQKHNHHFYGKINIFPSKQEEVTT